MHFAQAKTRLPRNGLAFLGYFIPAEIITHCKLGYFLFFEVGLYLPRSFLSFQTTVDVFPQIVQVFAIKDI